ncbi:MAG: OmpH family outer membrane protein [Deltaproteobacteria bacterium]|nr:OmpH family outer membrane protein [Deltaproteobacteria bacterium]
MALAVTMITLGSAQTWAAELKIGTIDMQQVISVSEPGVEAMDVLREKFEDMKKDIDKQQKDLEDLRESLQKQNLVLSQEAKEDKELEFKRRVRDFQDSYQAYQRKIKQEEEKLSKPVIEELAKIIEEFGRKNKFTAIFDSKGSGLLYADESVDLTGAIVAEFNRVWRAQKGKSGGAKE